MSESEVRRRPGGRGERVRAAVLGATIEAIAEVGVEKVGIVDVAARAGVHDTSIYRRWRTRENLVLEALLDHSGHHVPIPDTGSVRADLTEFVRLVNAHVHTPLGRALAQSMALNHDETLEPARARFWRARLDLAAAMIDRAVARGELPAATDPRLVLETLTAPLYMRALLTRLPLTNDDVQALVNLILTGLQTPAPRPAS
ncbi:TetR/AcrR family transcriptional regulator [Actinocorallia sp. API 0066]|uniref:TetR/AcrR family transcriptional regulator n=1 Tax=Actinocorallia sp. API 0066 TaxID=2896846 RepID=UPI001E5667E1|nr:TetR/AcrR family transcriptional regulator [Actinocorallia sp. API 0066]MCD0449316.1 TetR/AcrR family transcriptional regulator [Actinocorallia sp. API 0066]